MKKSWHEVKIVEQDQKYHFGCYNFLPSDGQGKGAKNKSPHEITHGYWSGESIKPKGYKNFNFQEFIVESPLQMLQKID